MRIKTGSFPLLATTMLCWLLPQVAAAQEAVETSKAATSGLGSLEYVFFGICVAGAVVALVQAWFFYQSMIASDPFCRSRCSSCLASGS